LERVDLVKSLTGASEAPVLEQFLPGGAPPMRARTEAGDARACCRSAPAYRSGSWRFDPRGGREVGRSVIVEGHRDDDPQEARDSRHTEDPAEQSGRSQKTTRPLPFKPTPSIWPRWIRSTSSRAIEVGGGDAGAAGSGHPDRARSACAEPSVSGSAPAYRSAAVEARVTVAAGSSVAGARAA
jgi:hypothetical protein